MALRTPPTFRPKVAIPVAVTIVVLILLFTVGVNTWINLLFFRETGFSKVFTTVLATKTELFFLVGLLPAVGVAVNAVLAHRLRPPFRPTSLEQQSLDVYRRLTDPWKVPVLVLAALGVGVIAGSAATGHWDTVLGWMNATSFGTLDPQFHKDVSFYVFTYPFLRFVLGVLFQTLFLSLVAAAAVHYFYGGIRLQTPGDKAVPAAKAHLSVLLGLILLVKAWAYWLDRYGLNFSRRGFVDTGASNTDIHVVLPGKTVLMIVSLVCALLLLANARARGWTLPVVSLGLLAFAAVVVGGVVPAVYQRFSVKPNEISKESAYIQRNIDATRVAYKLTPADVTTTDYDANKPVADARAAADTGTLQSIRLLDPQILSPTFEQLQRQKNYYGFTQSLDIDRYTVAGKNREFVVAAREVDQTGLAPSQQNWINQHLVYTHGQGLVAAPANSVDSQGQPIFDPPLGTGGLPQSGAIPVTQSRVYYGETSPAYSVVDTTQKEIDGVDSSNNYDGKGGVTMGGLFKKLAFAIKFKESNLLISGAIQNSSKILYFRTPRERVAKVAPWLTLDTDPYPAVVDGRIVWILDGYTTTDAYPYSARTTLSEATADTTNTGASAVGGQQGGNEVNYIRNSVKAVVDAGDGTVSLYAFDQSDPVLRTWMKAFPGTVKPRSAMSPELLAHMRYPEDLFKVQRELLAKYHVSDPQTFYKQSDFWSVPTDPSGGGNQPPFYVMSQSPGQSASTLNLTTTFNALQRPNLSAFVSVSSGGAGTGPTDLYGHLTLLRVTSESDGVGQVHNKFNSTPAFSTERTLLATGGSALTFGNLLAMPVGGSFVYVEPVYVTGSSNALSVMKRVLVRWRDRVGYAPNLTDALQQAFTGVGAAQVGTNETTTPTVPGGPSPSVSVTPSAVVPAGDLSSLLSQLEDEQRKTADIIAEIRRRIVASLAPSPSR